MHHWLPRLAYFDRFHRLAVLATARTESHRAVGQLYDEAIQRLSEKGEYDPDDDLNDTLRYFRASILFHGSTEPKEQAEAFAGEPPEVGNQYLLEQLAELLDD